MTSVNVHQAKTHLSRLLERVEKGEQIVISRAGRPVARLSPIRTPLRRPGRLKGKLHVAVDFDAPLPAEIQAALQGGGEEGELRRVRP